MARGPRVVLVLQPERTYYRRVLRGIFTFGTPLGWEWVAMTVEGLPPLRLLGDRVDGVIGDLTDSRAEGQLRAAGLPSVNIAPQSGSAGLSNVTNDDEAIGRLVASHFILMGRREFGFVGAVNELSDTLREQGFCSVIDATGRSRCHRYFEAPGRKQVGTGGTTETDHPLARWLRELPKPIGIMAGTDNRALQLLAMCKCLGISVPASVAVVGVGNDDTICELASPSLSSAALSTHHIGFEAARMLGAQMAGDGGPKRQLLIPPTCVVPRGSSTSRFAIDPDVAAALSFIALHAGDDLQVADILREVPLSRTALDEKFKKALGHTAAYEIRHAQLELAKRALIETSEPMANVAAIAGFSDAKQLGIAFRREFGTTPTRYRETSIAEWARNRS